MKISNRTIVIFVGLYVFFVLLFNAFILVGITPNSFTAKVPGHLRMCYNTPPEINYNCERFVFQNEEFYCILNVTDLDGNSFIYYLSFITERELYSITQQGLMNFTPNQSDVGEHSFVITVYDDSGCVNGVTSEIFNLTVINVNDPPILISPIPNQTWKQDTSLSPFCLEDYFWDPDEDQLTYTNTILEDISVTIDANSSCVLFVPRAGWSGTEEVVFIAWDPYYANGSSNNIKLTVLQTQQPPNPTPPKPPSIYSSSGGMSDFSISCIPKWYCRPWGECEPDNFRRRDCHDLNNCNTTFGRPNITEPCEYIHTCYDGIKGPDEEGIDCGGPCPPCGNCYDGICNNNEDCTRGLTDIPDCGGPCKPCEYAIETCYDDICNNNEDCTRGLTDIPDCGGPCNPCPSPEMPLKEKALNWALMVTLLLTLLVSLYSAKKIVPYIFLMRKKLKRKYYEERILLETKIVESILESLKKLESMLDTEDIEKLILLFSIIIRRYFKSLFKLKYEFTYEELMREIEKSAISPTYKSVLIKFFDRSTELEFSGKSVSREELKAMLSEFKHILSLSSMIPITDTKKAEKPGRTGTAAAAYKKITLAETLLREQELSKAYSIYLELLEEYKKMGQDDRIKIRVFLSRLYDEIKLARERYRQDKMMQEAESKRSVGSS